MSKRREYIEEERCANVRRGGMEEGWGDGGGRKCM